MGTLLTTIVIVGLLLFAAAAVVPGVVAVWRRVMNDSGTLQLWQMMRRRGLKPEDAAGEERALAVAVRRCTLCPSTEQCERWLAGEGEAPESFCPNATYLENLERSKRRAAAKLIPTSAKVAAPR
ncbi:MAG: hypothetical protein A3G28_02415 [Betaproteobacteria bacterium RIFCSPLOWO2_12_FULL_68_19]|nr:MAG: hypothetical protein A3G28_02415 [Betaproteobacteria bacterium RIFCSPLOWO2_12_FULL_68_19]